MNDALTISYGVTERFEPADEIEEALLELTINGYTVLDSGFDPGFIADLRTRLDRVYAEQVREAGGVAVLEAKKDADIARAVLAYDDAFLTVATAPPLLQLARRALGNAFVLVMQNGILNRPAEKNQQALWHRDLNYQHWTCSRPLAINALLCIDAFTYENGATHVLPGTHFVEKFPSLRYVSKFEQPLTAPEGSFLILNAMLYHRAGVNVSSRMRRAVNHVIGLPFMAQQIDLPCLLRKRGRDLSGDPATSRYLGYRWSPADDVGAWRDMR